MKALSDEKIVASWMKNVDPWVAAVRNGEIVSRVQTTNQAILDAVLAYDPKSILDIGCGEGWLVRELANFDINALGVDVVPALIESALDEGIGKFRIMSYEDITYDELMDKFDVVVSNFSLLGDESVSEMFQNIPSILTEKGRFIVQTIHPRTACGNEEYKDGWREGNWNGFSDEFTDPAPWYFRTIDSWKELFESNNIGIERIVEPVNQITGKPASIVFVGRRIN